jgi:hypothetical protein
VSRELEVNKPVEDALSVWELDGYSRRGGLVQTDFIVAFWRDGASVSPVFTLAEISATPGTYRLRWTPATTGFWYVEIENPVNSDVHVGEYDVLAEFAYKAVGLF